MKTARLAQTISLPARTAAVRAGVNLARDVVA